MTETAPDRLEAIRAALRELVAEYGYDPLSDPGRMSNLIKDLLPDDQQLARILVVAAEQDVASKLREHVSQGMAAPTAIRLVATSFAASTMFDSQACAAVVGELAIAIGLAPGESTLDVAQPPVSGLPGSPADGQPRLESALDSTAAGPFGAGMRQDTGPVRDISARQEIGGRQDTSGRQDTGAQIGAGQVKDVPAPPVARRSSARRSSYLAIAATAVVVVAAALILGLRGGAPASSHAPPQGSFSINRQVARSDSVVLTLTTIKLRDNRMTVYVVYRNPTKRTQVLFCFGETDASASTLTLANGVVVHSSATYCSDHPTLAATLGPGQTSTSYAVFRVPREFPEPFAFFWKAGDLSGNVANIRI